MTVGVHNVGSLSKYTVDILSGDRKLYNDFIRFTEI